MFDFPFAEEIIRSIDIKKTHTIEFVEPSFYGTMMFSNIINDKNPNKFVDWMVKFISDRAELDSEELEILKQNIDTIAKDFIPKYLFTPSPKLK